MSAKSSNNHSDLNLAKIRKYIKIQLRSKKMTYRILGEKLGVSEVTVKRWMTTRVINLRDIQRIAEILEIDFSWPINIGGQGRIASEEYSIPQEEFFAKNPKYFLFFIKLIIGLDLEEARAVAKIPEKNLIRVLRQMESLRILDLHVGNRVDIIIHGPFRWRRQGPIVRAYHELHSNLIFQNLMRMYPHPPQHANELEDGFVWPFETCLTINSTKAFKAELLQILHKYRTISAVERRMKLKVKTLGVIGAVGEFDAWLMTLKS
ncbi:MAG: helix-turn-helix domain-containing protein [Pseudobdellovibrionaceae bacterium]